MKKLLILLLMLILIVGFNIMFADKPKAQDTSKIFIYATAFGAFPTDQGALTYNPHFGFQFEGHYKMGRNISIGGTYKNWKLRADNAPQDMYAEHKAGILTYWVNDYGASFNVGFMGELGQSIISDENGTNRNFSEVYGMVIQKTIYQQLTVVGTVKIGRFGDLEQDNLMVSLGLGAPITF